MACDTSGNGRPVQGGLLACEHWEPSDGWADEGWHFVRTLVGGILVALVLSVAIWKAKTAFHKRAEAEAVRHRPSTVDVVPSVNDASTFASYRWCE